MLVKHVNDEEDGALLTALWKPIAEDESHPLEPFDQWSEGMFPNLDSDLGKEVDIEHDKSRSSEKSINIGGFEGFVLELRLYSMSRIPSRAWSFSLHEQEPSMPHVLYNQ